MFISIVSFYIDAFLDCIIILTLFYHYEDTFYTKFHKYNTNSEIFFEIFHKKKDILKSQFEYFSLYLRI
jgi:hypothetical protein